MSDPKDERAARMDDIESLGQRAMEKLEARRLAQEKLDIEQQTEAGRCRVIPMRRVESQPFRSELGIERTPIFVTSRFKGEWREYSRIVIDPATNEHIEQTVRVGKKHANDRPRGVLTQIHQEVFYKCLSLWDRAAYPLLKPADGSDDLALGYVVESAYNLVRTVFGGQYSGPRYARLRTILGDLCGIPIVREHRYLSNGTRDVDEFTLLNSADWEGRGIDHETGVPVGGGRSEVRIVFSRIVTLGFLRRQHKPLLLAPYLSLGAAGRGRRAELARLLYPILDHELSRKPTYHCKLQGLSQRLGLSEYRYRSDRRNKFVPAVKALDGLPILNEKFRLRVKLKESEDGTDWVLRAWRDAQENLPLG